MKNGDKPITPCVTKERLSGSPDYHQKIEIAHLGLTKREYFAGLAMQSLITKENLSGGIDNYTVIARHATLCADELLKQLETNP